MMVLAANAVWEKVLSDDDDNLKVLADDALDAVKRAEVERKGQKLGGIKFLQPGHRRWQRKRTRNCDRRRFYRQYQSLGTGTEPNDPDISDLL